MPAKSVPASRIQLLLLSLMVVMATTEATCLETTNSTLNYRSINFGDLMDQAPGVLYGTIQCTSGLSPCSSRKIHLEIHCILKQPEGSVPSPIITIEGDSAADICGNTTFTERQRTAGGEDAYVVLVERGGAESGWRWFEKYRDQGAAILYDATVLNTLSDSCSLDATWQDPSPSVGSRCPRKYQSIWPSCSHAQVMCPPYWYRSGDRCYALGTQPMGRGDSVAFCAVQGGSLASFPDDVTENHLLTKLGDPGAAWWTAAVKRVVNEAVTYQWNGVDIPSSVLASGAQDRFGDYLVINGSGYWSSVDSAYTAIPVCDSEPSMLPTLQDDPNLLISYVNEDYVLNFCCKHYRQEGSPLNMSENGGAYRSAQLLFNQKPKFYLRNAISSVASNYTIMLLDVSGKDATRGTKLEPYALWIVVDVPRDSRPASKGELRPDYGTTLLPTGKRVPDDLVSLEKEGREYVVLVFRQRRPIGHVNVSTLAPKARPRDSPVGSFLRLTELKNDWDLTQVANRWMRVLMDPYSIWHQVTQRGGHSTIWCPKYWPELADQVESGQVVCAKVLPPAMSHAATSTPTPLVVIFIVAWMLLHNDNC